MLKKNCVVILSFSMVSSFALLAGCSSPQISGYQPIHIEKTWHPPKICPAKLDENNAHIAYLQQQGVEFVELNNQLIILLPSDALFEINSAEFNPRAYVMLNELVEILKQYPGKYVRVEGNTDPVASYSHNKTLSTTQATQVAGYLWAHHIPQHPVSGHLTLKGNAEKQPIATNSKLAGMAKNRRIQITVYCKKPERDIPLIPLPKYAKSYGK